MFVSSEHESHESHRNIRKIRDSCSKDKRTKEHKNIKIMADYRLTQSGDQVQSILNNAAMQEALANETTRAEEAEQQLQTNINAEAGARQQADATLQGNIDTEEARAKAAEQLNADDIDAIEAKIPDAASDENQLVDEQKMNSSIATATATYRGAFNLVTDLT